MVCFFCRSMIPSILFLNVEVVLNKSTTNLKDSISFAGIEKFERFFSTNFNEANKGLQNFVSKSFNDRIISSLPFLIVFNSPYCFVFIIEMSFTIIFTWFMNRLVLKIGFLHNGHCFKHISLSFWSIHFDRASDSMVCLQSSKGEDTVHHKNLYIHAHILTLVYKAHNKVLDYIFRYIFWCILNADIPIHIFPQTSLQGICKRPCLHSPHVPKQISPQFSFCKHGSRHLSSVHFFAHRFLHKCPQVKIRSH
ncbi:hypothetical protein AGLY_008777 [Aphis glycines]|uniref:Uncharacterized protein n=1 Tax=Aphis glycines TaxID=307491 RepID=A0A6G0TLS8_APHGL|nr:hypothetical protein AGLY_008777 [Aphis glycines]